MKNKQQLIENFTSLSVLQLFNLLIPLLTAPYLVRVLGVENFGLINFSLSIIMYFHIITNFGFNISIPRKIANYNGDFEKISELFFTVILIKIILMFFSLILLSFLIFLVDVFYINIKLYFVTFGIVLGNVLFPIWFFQGIEKMKYISLINIVVKIIFTFLIFFVVKDTSDFIYVPILNSIGQIMGGIFSLIVVFTKFPIKFMFPTKDRILIELKESFEVFISRISNNGSRYFASTIIGLNFGNYVLGFYTIVEKLYYAFLSLPGVISQTIYPYMCRTRNLIFFKKMLFYVILLLFMVLIPILFYRDFILAFVFNLHDDMLSAFFLIIFIGAFFGTMNILIGYPLLGAFGYMKYANISLIIASIIYLVFILISCFIFDNIYFAVFSLVLYQIFGLIFRIFFLKRTGILKNV